MYDSTGLLSILDRYRRPGQARWVPLFDSSNSAAAAGDKGKQKESTYWPVGLTDSHFTCVILKGEKEPWFPRPLIQEVGLVMPLLNMDNEQGKREEAYVLSYTRCSRGVYDADILGQFEEK
jgi:chromosome transmission fidelity protein 4